jgi:hypothetical protein
MAESWLRIVTFALPEDRQVSSVDVAASLGGSAEILRRQPGFKGAYWGESPEDRTIAAVMHWSGLAAIEGAVDALRALTARRAEAGFIRTNAENIKLYAMYSDPRRSISVPPSGLVAGHAHGWRGRAERGGEILLDTRLRIVLSRVRGADDGDALRILRARSAESRALVQAQPGFVLGYAGANPDTGTAAAVTYWADADALMGAEPVLNQLLNDREETGVITESIRTFRLFPTPKEAQRAVSAATAM